jgi:CDGSH-type Zn-finger protein
MAKTIRILPDGPYEVTASVPVRRASIKIDKHRQSKDWEIDGNYDTGDDEVPYHLCRCGRSKNKPLCDGSHLKTIWEPKERASRAPFIKQAKVYVGEKIDMLDNEWLCSQMRFCHEHEGTWTNVIYSDDPENYKSALHSVNNCAAGRLVVIDKEGNPIEPKFEPEIDLIQDTANGVRGPLWIKGDIQLIGADGYEYEKRNRMTLCRCGESTNMPYCDRHHLNCRHMEGFDEI